MKVIQSVQNDIIKNIDKLNDKKTRINKQKFVVEGYHLVEEAYNHALLEAILTTKEEDFKKYQNRTWTEFLF